MPDMGMCRISGAEMSDMKACLIAVLDKCAGQSWATRLRQQLWHRAAHCCAVCLFLAMRSDRSQLDALVSTTVKAGPVERISALPAPVNQDLKAFLYGLGPWQKLLRLAAHCCCVICQAACCCQLELQKSPPAVVLA